MGLRKAFDTNKSLEKEGITLDLGYCRIKLARAGGGNKAYLAMMESVHKQYHKAIRFGALSNEKQADMLAEVYAETIVKNWETNIAEEGAEPEFVEGIEDVFSDDENASLLPVTKENITRVLKRLPDLFSECKTTAEDLTFYKQALLDDAAKNS